MQDFISGQITNISTASEGWFAEYKDPEGNLHYYRVACWVSIVEKCEGGSLSRVDAVSEGDFSDFDSTTDGFQRFVFKPGEAETVQELRKEMALLKESEAAAYDTAISLSEELATIN